MVVIKSKGTVLQGDVDGTLAALAQVISIDKSGMESLTFDANALDSGVGIPYQPTGDSEGGTCDFEFFLDPVLAGHAALLDLINDPCTYIDIDWKIIFADTATTEWPFVGAGFGLDVTVALGDGVKASASIKLDGIPTFP